MKIGIIGAGAIGLLTGAYLGRTHEVHMFVKKEDQRKVLSDEGIFCEPLAGPVAVHAHLVTDMCEGFDLWIVAVKQLAMDAFLERHLPSDAPYLFIQNGMGHLEKVASTALNSCVGVMEHGAIAKGANIVEHRGKGNMQMAAFEGIEDDRVEYLSRALHTTDFPVIFQSHYEAMLKKKLIINAVINPLTALFSQPNHSIVTNPSINELARALCREACFALELDFEEEWERVKVIADRTGENHSSMLKDLSEGKKTEVDSINGYILRSFQQSLPYHHFVMNAIRALEYERGIGKNE